MNAGEQIDRYDGFNSMVNYTTMTDNTLIEEIFVDEANNTVPYSKQRRQYGLGDLRLGKSVILEENIYTLAYIAALNNEEIDKVTQENEGRPPEMVEIM